MFGSTYLLFLAAMIMDENKLAPKQLVQTNKLDRVVKLGLKPTYIDYLSMFETDS